jgi:hypothetical protein
VATQRPTNSRIRYSSGMLNQRAFVCREVDVGFPLLEPNSDTVLSPVMT